jgi:hypothetical protein
MWALEYLSLSDTPSLEYVAGISPRQQFAPEQGLKVKLAMELTSKRCSSSRVGRLL